jgi:hypothetical protein
VPASKRARAGNRQEEWGISLGERKKAQDSAMSEEPPKTTETQIDLAVAQGAAIAIWARTMGVPRRTAFRWAKEGSARWSSLSAPRGRSGARPDHEDSPGGGHDHHARSAVASRAGSGDLRPTREGCVRASWLSRGFARPGFDARGHTTVTVGAEASFAALEYVTNEANRIRWLEMHKMRLDL